MSKLNIELLKKVRDKIANTPEAYDQSVRSNVEDCAVRHRGLHRWDGLARRRNAND